MKVAMLKSSTFVASIAVIAVIAGGCGKKETEPTGKSTPATKTSNQEQAENKSHDHGGWWCVEHGIPEETCSLCSEKAAAAFKAKGDWCKEHNRAESQCFKCDASRADKFAKLYEAKFGKKPPKFEDY